MAAGRDEHHLPGIEKFCRHRFTDRGQGSVEYVGTVIVVAVLLFLVIGVVGRSTAIGDSFGSAICRAFDGNDCESGTSETAEQEAEREARDSRADTDPDADTDTDTDPDADTDTDTGAARVRTAGVNGAAYADGARGVSTGENLSGEYLVWDCGFGERGYYCNWIPKNTCPARRGGEGLLVPWNSPLIDMVEPYRYEPPEEPHRSMGDPVPGTSVPTPDPPYWEPSESEGSGEYGSEYGWPDRFYLESWAWQAAAFVEPWMPEAAQYLQHYTDNTGETVEVDVDKLLADVSPLNDEYRERQGDIGEYAVLEAQALMAQDPAFAGSTEPMTFPVSTAWKGFDITGGMSKNWHLAVGGMQYSIVGQVTVYPPSTPDGQWFYTTTTSMEFRKLYSWDEGDKFDVGPIVIDADLLAKMHRAGMARDFEMTGSSESTTSEGMCIYGACT